MVKYRAIYAYLSDNYDDIWFSQCQQRSPEECRQPTRRYVAIQPYQNKAPPKWLHIDVLAQDCNNASALAMSFLQSCATSWRHQMETLAALLAFCAGNSPATGEFPTQRPVTQSLDVFFHLHLNKRLGKQSCGWWFETPSCPLWRHRNETIDISYEIYCITHPDPKVTLDNLPTTCDKQHFHVSSWWISTSEHTGTDNTHWLSIGTNKNSK